MGIFRFSNSIDFLILRDFELRASISLFLYEDLNIIFQIFLFYSLQGHQIYNLYIFIVRLVKN